MKNDQKKRTQISICSLILLLLLLTGCEGAEAVRESSLYSAFIQSGGWLTLLAGLGRTVIVIIGSTVGGCIVGAALFLWDYARGRLIHRILSGVSWFLVQLPVTTLLLIVFYIVFRGSGSRGMAASIFALSVNFGVQVYRNLYASINGIDGGQREAACSMGYNEGQTLRLILLPQAMPEILDVLETDLVFNINDSAVVGFVAVQDLQAVADAICARTVEPFLPLLLTSAVYVLLALGGRKLVHLLRRMLNRSGRTAEEIRTRVLKGKI